MIPEPPPGQCAIDPRPAFVPPPPPPVGVSSESAGAAAPRVTQRSAGEDLAGFSAPPGVRSGE